MASTNAELVLKIKDLASSGMKKFSAGLKSAAQRVKAVGLALVGIAAAGVAAFREQELSVNKLNQSLVQQGIFTKDLSKEYQTMASELQSVTTFGDEAIISAQAQLQAYLGQTKVTKELAKATLDFAAGAGTDLKSAADLIGKSVSTSTNALSRYGIEVDTSASKSQKLESVIGALNDRYGGQAEAAALGVGSLIQMKNSMGDLLEVVGKQLAPIITIFAKQLQLLSTELQTNKDFIRGLDSTISFLSKSFAFLKFGVITTTAAISTGLAAAIESVSLIMDGQFSRAKDVASDGMTAVQEIIKERTETFNEEMAEIDASRANADEMRRISEEQLKAQSEVRSTQIQQQEAVKRAKISKKEAEDKAKIEQAAQKKREEAAAKESQLKKDTLSTISTLQNSNNKALAIAGKGAALTQIAIDTPVAVGKALAAFPPPFNFIAAGLVGAAMAAQAARVAGISLADGGIVPASVGGTAAIIGEGGRDEAVIPLDDAGGGVGGGTTINFNGPILGDESQAREFAVMLDKELLNLRRENQSVAFDSGVI